MSGKKRYIHQTVRDAQLLRAFALEWEYITATGEWAEMVRRARASRMVRSKRHATGMCLLWSMRYNPVFLCTSPWYRNERKRGPKPQPMDRCADSRGFAQELVRITKDAGWQDIVDRVAISRWFLTPRQAQQRECALGYEWPINAAMRTFSDLAEIAKTPAKPHYHRVGIAWLSDGDSIPPAPGSSAQLFDTVRMLMHEARKMHATAMQMARAEKEPQP